MFVWLVYFLIQLSLLGGLFLLWKKRTVFEHLLMAEILLIGVHLSLILAHSTYPLALGYAPLLVMLLKNVIGQQTTKKAFILQFAPLLIAGGIYPLVHAADPQSYYLAYLSLSLLSLTVAGIWGALAAGRAERLAGHKSVFIWQLLTLNVIGILFLGMLLAKQAGFMPAEGYASLSTLISFTMIFTMFLLGRSLVFLRREKLVDTQSQPGGDVLARAPEFTLSSQQLAAYELRLRELYETERLYLLPELSLSLLSAKTDIPKHHFSQLFSLQLKQSFYQFTAQYRIAFAKELMDQGTLMTLESLAYESGFNSKSSFNRYFKEFTGYRPSEYRELKAAGL